MCFLSVLFLFLYNIFAMNENKAMDSHLDYLSSYKKIKTVLDGIDEMNILHFFDYDSFLSLWSLKPIDSTKKDAKYVCPIFLFNKESNIYIPFLIFDSEYRDDNLYLKPILPLINPVVIELMSDDGITVPDDFTWDSIPMYLNTIEKLLETNKKKDSYSLAFGISFLDSKYALYISVYPFLSERLKGTEMEEKYKGLFQERRDAKIESEIEKENLGCFIRFERAKKRLLSYKSAKISYSGKDIGADVLLRFLDSFAEKKESVLLLAPESRIDDIKSILSSSSLDDFVFDYDKYSLSYVESIIDKDNYKELTDEDCILIQSYEQKRERYLSFYEKKEECFSVLRKYLSKEEIEYILQNRNVESYPLNVSNYKDEDFKKDEKFLTSLSSYDRVVNTYLENHSLYGLSSDSSREAYDSLQLVIIRLLSTLKKISTMTEDDSIFMDYGISIHSIDEYERVKESFALLAEYNGFPKKYFKANQSGQKRLSLPQLKLRYQAVSSSQLLVSNFMDETIFDIDISSLLSSYEKGNFFEKIKAKRKISSYLKEKKGTDMKTVIRILHSYVQSKAELERVLPDYLEVYGENVNTMNGVMEIESNIKYIDKFNRYSIKNPLFNLDHPFIRRYLKDKDFRVDSQHQFKELSSTYIELEKELNEFLSYFKKGNKKYQSFSITKLNDEIVTIQKQDYEAYHQYAEFIIGLEDTSKLLQHTVSEYILNKRILIDFEKEFKVNLAHSCYLECEKQFSSYEKGYETAKVEYEDSLSSTKRVRDVMRYQNLKDNVLYFRSTQPVERKKIIDKIEGLTYDRNDKAEFLSSIFKLAPISIGTAVTVPSLDDDSYDHVIIFDSGLFNNEELIDAFRLGKDVLLLNERSLFDSRTQFYHQTLINREVLYQKVFDFSSLSQDMIALIKGRRDFICEDVYPFVVKENDKNYAILPDLLLDNEHDIHFICELAMFLSEHDDLNLSLVDILSLIFDKKKA